MLEEAIHSVEHEIQRDYIGTYAQQHEGQGVECHLQRFFQRVKASDVEPIELCGRVVDGMQPPQRRVAMRCAMQPVTQEIGSEQHQYRLRPDRPVVRPDIPEHPAHRMQRLDQEQHEQEGHSGRQQHLHQRHKSQIVGHGRAIGLPGVPVRETPFQPGHQRGPGKRRDIHCPGQGHARHAQGVIQPQAEGHGRRVDQPGRQLIERGGHDSARSGAASWPAPDGTG